HTVQVRNSGSPSRHSPLALSSVRGVDATVNLATATPAGVNRNSGASVRFPAIVIVVSPDISSGLPPLASHPGGHRTGRSLVCPMWTAGWGDRPDGWRSGRGPARVGVQRVPAPPRGGGVGLGLARHGGLHAGGAGLARAHGRGLRLGEHRAV